MKIFEGSPLIVPSEERIESASFPTVEALQKELVVNPNQYRLNSVSVVFDDGRKEIITGPRILVSIEQIVGGVQKEKGVVLKSIEVTKFEQPK